MQTSLRRSSLRAAAARLARAHGALGSFLAIIAWRAKKQKRAR